LPFERLKLNVVGSRPINEDTSPDRKQGIPYRNPWSSTNTTSVKKAQLNLHLPKSVVSNQTFSRIVRPNFDNIPPPKKSVESNQTFSRIVRPNFDNIPPPKKSTVLDESPSHIVGPYTQELQDIKDMISILQLDLQEERCKRECLEEKLRKFEVYQDRQSQNTSENKWRLSETTSHDEEITQNQSFLSAPNTIKDVNKNIEELSSNFHQRLQNLDQSVLEIRSVLAKYPADGPKGDKKSLLEAGPSKDMDYNRFLYKKLERGIFPRQMSLKNAIMRSVDELLHKPWSEKTEIEAKMDQYYLDNLPPAFLQPDAVENEDREPDTDIRGMQILKRKARRKNL
jgi:hypothetical protein